MSQSADTTRFLRAAVKAGLRMQARAGGGAGPEGAAPRSEGVAVLQRIKASLQKRTLKRH